MIRKHLVFFLEPKGTAFEVIKAAKERGYYIIVLSLDGNIAIQIADIYALNAHLIDRIIQIENWNNYNNILKIIKSFESIGQIAGIYSNREQSIQAATFIRHYFNLPATPIENLSKIINKYSLRKRLKETGLSSLFHVHGSEADKWEEWQFNGAAYFKPVHGAASVCVFRCESLNDISNSKMYWTESKNHLPAIYHNYIHYTEEYYLEEAIDGELLSVEAIVTNGEFKCLGLLSRILYSQNSTVEMGSCFPYDHPLYEKIVSLVKKAHQVLGFTEGPTHTEVMVKGNRIEIIDFNPRFVGAEVLFSINNALGMNIEEILLEWVTGKSPSMGFINPKKYACLQYLLPPPNIKKILSIDFPSHQSIKLKSILVSKGKILSDNTNQLDVIGFYLTVGSTFDEAFHLSRMLRSQILVNGKYQARY